ncbi:hypothetical protein [Methanothrix soehngenii]|nr:hypothetical protein [Methanothrix soehngenii]HOS23410.1 hypothetical protein [Methanothrix soehngenii]HPL21695.1 hypothetical protein [Methanothrix soehngenii]
MLDEQDAIERHLDSSLELYCPGFELWPRSALTIQGDRIGCRP